MATQWIKPTTVYQYAESGGENVHIPWNFSSISTNGILPIKLNENLVHIARSPKPNIVNKTYYIQFSNFLLTDIPNQLSGIDLLLNVSRNGRITDDTIQLKTGTTVISSNAANLIVENSKIYNFTIAPALLLDDEFAVELRFKSHPSWPHNETIVINSVEIRLY